MNIEILKFTPDFAEDYINFFDITPHDYNVDEHKCYCVCWSNDDYKNRDFSTAEKRRKYALQYVKNNNIQGYLAYNGDIIVGWCNANTKSDCLECCSWRRSMVYVPLDEPNTKVKSVFCYVIAPEMKRKGIATLLLERVCKDAVQDGFDFVEAYPYSDFGGHFEMYKKCGFYISSDTEKGLIMRKQLK